VPTGRITYANDEKFYGFIKPDEPDADDVFFHERALNGLTFGDGLKGRRVEFERMETDKGPRASNVRATT